MANDYGTAYTMLKGGRFISTTHLGYRIIGHDLHGVSGALHGDTRALKLERRVLQLHTHIRAQSIIGWHDHVDFFMNRTSGEVAWLTHRVSGMGQVVRPQPELMESLVVQHAFLCLHAPENDDSHVQQRLGTILHSHIIYRRAAEKTERFGDTVMEDYNALSISIATKMR